MIVQGKFWDKRKNKIAVIEITFSSASQMSFSNSATNFKQSFKVSLDKQEQFSRRNCLLIHGLPEN